MNCLLFAWQFVIIPKLQMTDRKIEELRTGIEDSVWRTSRFLGQFIMVEMKQNSSHSIHSVTHFIE